MRRYPAIFAVVGLSILLSVSWMIGCGSSDQTDEEAGDRSSQSVGEILGRCVVPPPSWPVENKNNAQTCKTMCASLKDSSIVSALLNNPGRAGNEVCCCYVPETAAHQSKCGPTNCLGCCSNGVCKTGKDDKICGSEGAACMDCQASNAKCQSGYCMYSPAHFDARVPR